MLSFLDLPKTLTSPDQLISADLPWGCGSLRKARTCVQPVNQGGGFMWVNQGTFPQAKFHNIFCGYKSVSFPVLCNLFTRVSAHIVLVFLRSYSVTFPHYTHGLLKKLLVK